MGDMRSCWQCHALVPRSISCSCGADRIELSEKTDRIAELEQQLAAAQAELAALREPVEGLRLIPEEVERIFSEGWDHQSDQEIGALCADWLAMHRIIGDLREQLASRDALREPVEGLRLTREEVSRFGIQDFEAGELLADLRAAHRIIAQQQEQLASRDGWVRTADRLPTEADAPHGDVIWWSTLTECAVSGHWTNHAAWRTHWMRMPAPPADDEGGDDERS